MARIPVTAMIARKRISEAAEGPRAEKLETQLRAMPETESVHQAKARQAL